MADQASLALHLGWWMDKADNIEPEKVLTVHFGGMEEPTRNEIIQTTASAQMRPWAYEYNYSAYFANAAADGVGIIIVAAPILTEAVFSGAAEVFFQHVASRLLSIFKSSGHTLTMESAQQSAEHVLMYQAGLAKPDLRELLAKQQGDGSFMFQYRDERTGDDHLVVVGDSGALAHANLTALSMSLDTLRERDKQYRTGN